MEGKGTPEDPIIIDSLSQFSDMLFNPHKYSLKLVPVIDVEATEVKKEPLDHGPAYRDSKWNESGLQGCAFGRPELPKFPIPPMTKREAQEFIEAFFPDNPEVGRLLVDMEQNDNEPRSIEFGTSEALTTEKLDKLTQELYTGVQSPWGVTFIDPSGQPSMYMDLESNQHYHFGMFNNPFWTPTLFDLGPTVPYVWPTKGRKNKGNRGGNRNGWLKKLQRGQHAET